MDSFGQFHFQLLLLLWVRKSIRIIKKYLKSLTFTDRQKLVWSLDIFDVCILFYCGRCHCPWACSSLRNFLGLQFNVLLFNALQERFWCRTASCWWWAASRSSTWSWHWVSTIAKAPSPAGVGSCLFSKVTLEFVYNTD